MRLTSHRTTDLALRTRAYIDRHPEESLRLRDLAGALRASPSRLAYSFRKVHGIPLARYALALRLQRAATLLSGSDDLARLAVDLGFASHSHFSRTFARWAGLTPSAYRARMRAAGEARSLSASDAVFSG